MFAKSPPRGVDKGGIACYAGYSVKKEDKKMTQASDGGPLRIGNILLGVAMLTFGAAMVLAWFQAAPAVCVGLAGVTVPLIFAAAILNTRREARNG